MKLDAKAKIKLTLGKVAGINLGNVFNFNSILAVRVKPPTQATVKLSGRIDFGKVIGGRDVNIVVNGPLVSFSSPATCVFPFDIKAGAKVSELKSNPIGTLLQNAKSGVPDGATLTRCAGKIFYAMKDGAVYAYNEAKKLANLPAEFVNDPVGTAKKIGAGIKMVNGAIADAPGEAAEAALKIGGELGKLGANVGGEIVGQLSNVGGSALQAGRAAGNAIRNIGGGISSGAKKVGCSLGLGGCKKKRPPAPGRKVAWKLINDSGWDIAASANTAEKAWMIDRDLRPRVLEKGRSRFSKTIARLPNGTEVRDFRSVSVGPRDSLLLVGKSGKLYFSDGKRNGDKLTITEVRAPNSPVLKVAIRKSVAWLLVSGSVPGGAPIYRSAFDGTLKSLSFKPVTGTGATAIDVDPSGNAWIVVNHKNIKKYSKSGWQNVAPFLDSVSAQKYKIVHITVDDHYRPWVSMTGTKYNLFALTPNGWLQHQGGMLNLSARGKHLWGIGSGGKKNFYKASLPTYISEAPADDWRYTLASEASTSDDFCLYSNKPTRTVTMVNQPVTLKACANNPVPQEQFFMQNIDGNYIRIISSTTKLCVGLSTGSKINGGQVQLLPCSATDRRQQWLMKTLNGTYSLQSRQSLKCLSVVGKVAKKDALLEQTTCGAGNEQKFQITSLLKEKLASGLNSSPAAFSQSPSAWVRVLEAKGFCMSANKKYKSVYAWNCEGNNINQQFQIGGNKFQKGYTTIYSLTQKKCLSVYATAVVKSSRIVVPKLEINSVACNLKAPTQAWGLLPVGQGYFQLINRRFGLCAERPNGGKGTKNRFSLTKCNKTFSRQQFRNYNVVAK